MSGQRDHNELDVPSDNSRTRRYRQLQSRWRATVLGVEPGHHPSGRLVGSLLPDSAPPDAQWLTPIIAGYVHRRVPEVIAARGTLELDRLTRNLLSSQPLCFNVFGQFAAFPVAAARVLGDVLDLDLRTIREVLVEDAPHAAARLLGDRSAFDASLIAEGPEIAYLVCVETKYTEPFSAREYMRTEYTSATDAPTSWFQSGSASEARLSTTNQLWRTLMLAQLAEQEAEAAVEALVLVLTADGDDHARRAVAGLRPLLKEPDRRLRHVTLDAIVAAAAEEPDLRAWSRLFHARYLDLPT